MRTELTGSIQLMNKLNKSRILTLVRGGGPISRVGLARLTNLSHTAISANVRALLGQGLLVEKELGESSGGRKPILLEFQPKGRYVVGVDVGRGHCNAALADLSGEVAVCQHESLSCSDESYVLGVLCRTVDQVIADVHCEERLLGIGVSVPGIVDHVRGVCRWSLNLGWENVPVGSKLSERYGVPAFVEKDSNAVGLAEIWFGEDRPKGLVLGITLDAGIGLSIIDGDEVYRGVDGSAGEIGHMTVDYDGPRCPCGGRGCLELFASEKAILRRYAERVGDGSLTQVPNTIESILSAADSGEKAALEVIEEACSYLGIAVLSLIRVFNPGEVVFGGRVASLSELFVTMTRKAIERNSQPLWGIGTEVRLSRLGGDAALKGALALVLRRVFDVDCEDPVLF